MKTILQALRDEVFYPIPLGKVENIAMRRGLNCESVMTAGVANSNEYRGAFADCLWSLVQSVGFSENGVSVSAITDAQRRAIMAQVNKIYSDLGEDEVKLDLEPTVYIMS